MKKCSVCKQDKQLEKFNKDKTKKDLHSSTCKICNSIKTKQWKANNLSRFKFLQKKWDSAPEQKLKKKTKYKKNKEVALQQKRQYYLKKSEEIKAKQRKYYEKNKSKILKKMHLYILNRYNKDINFKLRMLCRNRIFYATKGNKSKTTQDLIGCSIEQLKKHLESKFQLGMSWDNHGEWHIDHIKPLSSFDLMSPKECKKACHYTNLQPLWAIDNLKKAAKDV